MKKKSYIFKLYINEELIISIKSYYIKFYTTANNFNRHANIPFNHIHLLKSKPNTILVLYFKTLHRYYIRACISISIQISICMSCIKNHLKIVFELFKKKN